MMLIPPNTMFTAHWMCMQSMILKHVNSNKMDTLTKQIIM